MLDFAYFVFIPLKTKKGPKPLGHFKNISLVHINQPISTKVIEFKVQLILLRGNNDFGKQLIQIISFK